jgi:hypothetical protein
VLYKPEFFEPLTEAPWDEGRVRAGVSEIVAEAEAAFDPVALWLADEEDLGGVARAPLTTLYAGAAGIAWAFDRLGSKLDLGAAARRALEVWREEPDVPEHLEPPVRTHASLFWGETGPLFVACRLGGDAAIADDLYARVRENMDSETNELMRGSPGTMLVAKAMLDSTGDQRWAEAWRASAEILWDRRNDEGLWPSPPYGPGLGAAHGVGTNTNVLLQGGDLFAHDRPALERETAAALARYAVVEDGLANWPMVPGEDLVAWDGQIRVQWCHGAAGVVTSAAGYLDEELLLAGAELCWRVGPPVMDKGPGLCHGTAGTGYAFLKTFERTGDERWLERARRFAAHALEQVRRRGRPRHSLMTGDIGAALFASDCLEVRTQFPIVDVL